MPCRERTVAVAFPSCQGRLTSGKPHPEYAQCHRKRGGMQMTFVAARPALRAHRSSRLLEPSKRRAGGEREPLIGSLVEAAEGVVGQRL
jgi:hypothetical protein